MKLITPESSSLRIWLVLFMVCFVVVNVMVSAVWVLACLSQDAPLSGFRWIFLGSFIVGAVAATKGTAVALAERREQRERTFSTVGHHPMLGEYRSWRSGSSWSCRMFVTNGVEVTLQANGPSPSDEHVTQWNRVSREWTELTALVSRSLQPPKPNVDISSIKLIPTTVYILPSGEVEIGFTDEFVCDEADMSPTAYFSQSLELRSVEWSG